MHKHMDLYSELGVTPQADADAIDAAYRALAQRYRPDRRTGSAALLQARMARIQHAYSVLSQPESRQAYDASRNVASPRFVSPLIHTSSCRTLVQGSQPFLTTYDAPSQACSWGP